MKTRRAIAEMRLIKSIVPWLSGWVVSLSINNRMIQGIKSCAPTKPSMVRVVIKMSFQYFRASFPSRLNGFKIDFLFK